jgi:hypothetical protein
MIIVEPSQVQHMGSDCAKNPRLNRGSEAYGVKPADGSSRPVISAIIRATEASSSRSMLAEPHGTQADEAGCQCILHCHD